MASGIFLVVGRNHYISRKNSHSIPLSVNSGCDVTVNARLKLTQAV